MKIQGSVVKEKLIQRLNRIEGQVRGVQSMLEQERDCREIMQQLIAIHSAVRSASRSFFQEYASVCMLEMEKAPGVGPSEQQARRENLVQEMIALLDKVP
jgi:DNA-binding FrmR family transcriptional regulator